MNAARSVGLAKYYMQRRGIPDENLVILWVTDHETCSREDYDQKILKPVRRKLQRFEPRFKIRCLVMMFGVPLKIKGPGTVKALPRTSASSEEKQMNSVDGDCRASVDSEIALARKDGYKLAGWIPNPFYVGFQAREALIERNRVLMVSRLDAPSSGIVKRLIDDSLRVEKTGLSGTAYFDARWPKPENSTMSGYALYDNSIHLAAERIRARGKIPVVLDAGPGLFQPGACPGAALYCGWYRLAEYVDAFQWQPGAVGYHIASSECRTLKNVESQVWCKRMLEEGAAAVIGPVNEPYVQSFPMPEVFFSTLIDGYLTLAECYLISTPFWSWKMVLIGDPLYRPFKENR